MAIATPMAIRLEIIRRYKTGMKISQIAKEIDLSRGTIHSLINRYLIEGEKGLNPRYSNCGKLRPSEKDFIYRAVRCMRKWHPTWGGEKIHAELLLSRPKLKLPEVRTLYRWFNWEDLTPSRTRLPKAVKSWAKELHEGWQVDAKEEMRTVDGEKQCWLNIVDEHSGTVIDPPVFPPQEDM